MAEAKIKVFNNSLRLAQALALEWKESVLKADLDGRIFSVALCGGKTPAEFFKQIAKKEIKNYIPWKKVHLFWGDERCVPPDDIDSNYRVVHETLIDVIPIPPQNVHRIRGEDDPELEARRYEREICSLLCNGNNSLPSFDWVILGLGIDGHTASLFPGENYGLEVTDICANTKHPETGQGRITLTMPIINQAGQVVFLATGRNKAKVIFDVVEKTLPVKSCPASYVNPKNGLLQWWLDKEAASLLKS